MAMSLRSMMLVGGGLGLLYAYSPKFRHAVQPTVRAAAKQLQSLRQEGRSFREEFSAGSDDIRTLAERVARLEKNLGQGHNRTNEYQSDFYIH